MTYTLKTILGDKPGTKTITLKRGDTAPNPASTKRRFHGPCVLTYIRHVDGGIEVRQNPNQNERG